MDISLLTNTFGATASIPNNVGGNKYVLVRVMSVQPDIDIKIMSAKNRMYPYLIFLSASNVVGGE